MAEAGDEPDKDIFHYEELTVSGAGTRHIRVLDLMPGIRGQPLSCQLRQIQLKDADSVESYEALSYCWGHPSPTDRI
jgi:hypothetical protein